MGEYRCLSTNQRSPIHICLRARSTVKRIVTTSRTVAAWSIYNQEVKTFTELDWNEQDVAWVNDESRGFDHIAAYSASKALAEKGRYSFGNRSQTHM